MVIPGAALAEFLEEPRKHAIKDSATLPVSGI
jgi:hypothetical protein